VNVTTDTFQAKVAHERIRSILVPNSSWLLGLGVACGQLAADLVLHRRVQPLYQDGAAYHQLATRLSQHGAFGPPVAFRPPGWVFLLATVYRITGVHPMAGLVINAALSGATAVLLLHLGRRLGLPPVAAWLAALGSGLFPWLLMLGATLYSEPFYIFLLVALALGVVTLVQSPRRGAWRWGIIGALGGVAALVRPAFLVWLPIGLVLALRRGGARPVRSAMALCIGLIAVLAPWTVRNYLRLHSFVPIDTAGGATLATANNDLARAGQSQAGLPVLPPGTETQGDRAYRKAALHWIAGHPAGFAALTVRRLVRGVDPTALLNNGVVGSTSSRWLARCLWAVVLGVGAVGIAFHHRREWSVLLTFLIPQAFEIALFGGGFRFFAPCVPLLATWAGAGAAVLWPHPPRPHRLSYQGLPAGGRH
jgi:hypothetical protein